MRPPPPSNGALQPEPRICIRCRSGIRIQRPLCLHMASIRIQAVHEQSNAGSMCAVWSSRATTLNPDRDPYPVNLFFSARVETPIVGIHMSLIHSRCTTFDNIDFEERGTEVLLQNVPTGLYKIVVKIKF